jgi:hypothetical protein
MGGVYRRRPFYERLRPGSVPRGVGAVVPIFDIGGPPPSGTLLEITQFPLETGELVSNVALDETQFAIETGEAFMPELHITQFAIETGYIRGARTRVRFIGL